MRPSFSNDDTDENGEISDEYRRALALQAQGPDEFPFGYYLYLARLESEAASDQALD